MLRRNPKSLVAVAIVALILVGVAIVEGDLPDALTHVGALVIDLLNRFGAAAVAISTAIWAAVGLWLGAMVGEAIGNVLFDQCWIYFAGLGLAIVALAVALVGAWRRWGLSRAVSA